MSDDRGEFCDTNVFMYAYDVSAGDKRRKARDLVERLWVSGTGVISVQVLQELFVSLTRKASPSLQPSDAREIVEDLTTWKVIEPSGRDVLEAIDLCVRWGISLWDAMVLTAARKAGAPVVWSEDLKDGESYDRVVVRNPFRE
jgi:predicted nucleic acid-binding protein